MSKNHGLFVTVRAIGSTAMDRQITFLAASVAYYAFVSLIPALLLLVVVATTVGGEAFASQLLDLTQGFITPAGQEMIETAVVSAAGRGGATIVGIAVLGWGTLKVFRALHTAFATVYGQREELSFLGQFRDASIAVVAIGLGVASMLAIGTAVAIAPLGALTPIVGAILLPALLTVVLLPIYRQFPSPPIPFRRALPGAAFAAIGWAFLQAGFQLYAANAAQFQVYGVIGGVLLLVTWLYVAAILLILGAVINAVLSGDRSPEELTASASGASSGTLDRDRQLQHGPGRGFDRMASEGTDDRESKRADDRQRRRTDDRGSDRADRREGVSPSGAPDVAELDERLEALRAEFDGFEADVRERTVEKPTLEAELERYVRRQMRRGKARGWGPYLVLLYGTAMTLGAFFFFESDALAIVAMIVIFLSTLGLYVLFVLFGIGLRFLDVPGRAIDFVRDRRG